MFGQAEAMPIPLYLTLLNLGEGSEVEVVALKHLMGTDTNSPPQTASLLADFNWRLQLVGAVAT